MTPREISEMLNRQALEVSRLLLPGGKLKSGEWEVGNTEGDAGKSMKISVQGNKSGVWSDFATGESGDLLDLWCAVRKVGLAEALKQAKSFLGVAEKDSVFEGVPKKKFTRPQKPKCAVVGGVVEQYLIDERKLSAETIKKFKIAAQGENVIFPFLRDGELIMCKYRNIRDKSKIGVTSKDQEPCLFGWQALDENTRTVAIVEGEFDAMALCEYSIQALSVPFGGGEGAKQRWIDYEFENLQRFDVIYLAMDNDREGRVAVKEIVKRLGAHRCRVVTLPEKDANECLKQGVPGEMVHQCFAHAVTLDPEELKQASSFEDDVLAEFYPEDYPETPSFVGPWPKTHTDLQFRMSELIIVNGINGHGKSQLVGHLILEALRQSNRCCVASLELKPGKLLGRLTAQACGLPEGRPDRSYISAVMNWYTDKLWTFNLVGTAKQKRLLEVFEYAVMRYQIKVFVIDSLLKCGLGEDDYNGQKLFIEALCDFKNKYDVCILLVTHSRKSESEMKIGGKMDVRGSSAIADLADSILIAHRNKRKEKKLAKPDPDTDLTDLEEQPDAYLICDKQRNGKWEGTVGLWFCKNSNQFLSGPNQRPFQYVNYSRQDTRKTA